MLTACGCIANKEQTEILTPCQLHAAWAKTYAAQTWGDAAGRAIQHAQALRTRGVYTAPPPDRRSTDVTR